MKKDVPTKNTKVLRKALGLSSAQFKELKTAQKAEFAAFSPNQEIGTPVGSRKTRSTAPPNAPSPVASVGSGSVGVVVQDDASQPEASAPVEESSAEAAEEHALRAPPALERE